MDRAGDVFIADSAADRVVELPRTETGYGPQTTLSASGFYYPEGVAVDRAGDVFILDYFTRVVELPVTATGFGPHINLPASGCIQATELPWTAPEMSSYHQLGQSPTA